MAQQVFNQWLPVAKAQNEQGQEVYLPFAGIHMQTRDGNDEVIVGAGNMVWTGSMWVPVSPQNRLPVDAAVSGTVDVSDRADRQLGQVALSGSNLALRQTIVTGAKTVTSTAAEIFAGSSRLAGRHAMVITNVGTDHVYIGASGVTTNNGFPLFPGDTIRIDFNPSSSVPVFAVSDGANVNVRVVELA